MLGGGEADGNAGLNGMVGAVALKLVGIVDGGGNIRGNGIGRGIGGGSTRELRREDNIATKYP